jgi:hypothetical protein
VRFASDTVLVKVKIGKGEVSDVYRCDNGIFARDIILPRELKKGDIGELEYALAFQSPEPGDNSFRREALRRIEDILIEVRFHPRNLPRSVWWSTWVDYQQDTPPYIREPVELDERRHSVSKALSFAERSVIGFSWEWPKQKPLRRYNLHAGPSGADPSKQSD